MRRLLTRGVSHSIEMVEFLGSPFVLRFEGGARTRKKYIFNFFSKVLNYMIVLFYKEDFIKSSFLDL